MARSGELQGHALLIDARGGEAGDPRRAPLAHLAEVLRATNRSWLVRRLGGGLGDDFSVDRRLIQRELELLQLGRPAVALVVLAGELVPYGEGAALVTGAVFRDDVDAEPLPLAWLGAQLAECEATQLVVIASLQFKDRVVGDDVDDGARRARIAEELLAASLVERASLAVVELSIGGGGAESRAITAVVDGLRGAAIDPRRGAITASSLAAFLRSQLPTAVLQRSGADAVLLEAPPLERLWDLGWLSHGSLRSAAARATPVVGADSLLDTTLPGRFRIDAALASGGFGTVYRARQLSVDRDVAIKVLRSSADPFSEEGRLFVHEIQAVGKIDHPNVVRVYQADVTADGRLFFAMELLAGRDLQAVIDEGSVPWARARGWMLQLLAALEAAHRVGLVHADVKPANAIVVAAADDAAAERLVLLDFGLARLRREADASLESVGGTPAFMAPEQLREGRIDARSDLFSAALVFVAMLTGWRRRSAAELAPPDDVVARIADERVRSAVRRALELDPALRFPSAAEFRAALGDKTSNAVVQVARPPFLGLASFTEDDRGRLHGRDRELERLTELVLYRRVVVVTAPSGVGKTSLLRAGLIPRLESLGMRALVASCRSDDATSVLEILSPSVSPSLDETQPHGATARVRATRPPPASLEEAASRIAERGETLVLVVDQVEDSLLRADASPAEDLLDSVLALITRRPRSVSIVLAVREDFLARLIDRMASPADPSRILGSDRPSRRRFAPLGHGDRAPIVRIGPLEPAGARDAITRPLAERHISVEPDLLDRLTTDLVAAGAQLGAELGWSAEQPIYPPHLQLTCVVLHERLPAGEATITLAHYRSLGGFDAIVGEHLERVLDRLGPRDASVARDLFVSLVVHNHGRAGRAEAELLDVLAPEQRALLPAVLETLRSEGLVVRAHRPGGEPVWELIHDSLVPRVLAWIDTRDLARRRAVELVRYHLRRSSPATPSLLSRAELREVLSQPAAVAELEAEWGRQELPMKESALGPATLVARSRQHHFWITTFAAALVVTVIAGVATAALERRRSAITLAAEAQKRDRNLGLVTLELVPFDWDVAALRPVPVSLAALPSLSWSLHAPLYEQPDVPEPQPLPSARARLLSSKTAADGYSRIDQIEASGGTSFLVLHGRGRRGESCADSLIRIDALPGYPERAKEPTRWLVRVPTCQASRADTIDIPAGPFFFGGAGEPPSSYWAEIQLAPVRIRDEPRFSIDRTEVTNAAFSVFTSMSQATKISPVDYPGLRDLRFAALPQSPASLVTWRDAAAYCAFLGKQLPSSSQWEKAMRGGIVVDGKLNPAPQRSFPWGDDRVERVANLKDEVPPGVRPVASFPGDRSVYGVMDLAGNVQEWVSSAADGFNEKEFFRQRLRMTRGGNWSETPASDLVNFVPLENARVGGTTGYMLGWRCASSR